jgi:hypothetical protein
MSNSMFDRDVTLESVLEKVPDGGVAKVVQNTFWVKGSLGEVEEKFAPYLRIGVSVWQTKQDIEEGGSPEDIVAHALGVGERDEPGRWSAKVTVLDGKEFERGHPATGLAHSVGNNGVPGGFETYTWTTRLQIEENTLLIENP